ncbi:MAG: HD domain-containing protein [Deltaproteobacteria bacterium]|nr:HD domain-containing protein [Deltaproteobacteria bacterium]
MEAIVDLLFEARILKELPRSGYHFLGAGRETVAEHSFLVTVVGFVLSCMHPDVNRLKLLEMCLVHDLAESRTGDLNSVQKKYVVADERKAEKDLCKSLAFGTHMADLFAEFHACRTQEAKLAHDADQIALLLELKALKDTGHKGPEHWIPRVLARLHTDGGKRLGQGVLNRAFDAWWFDEKYDRSNS